MINELSKQVGSPTYIKTPTFHKDNGSGSNLSGLVSPGINDGDGGFKRKKRGNRSNDSINDNDWESVRHFQTTTIVHKVGIDGQIDLIRSALNKMSDKNYNEQYGKIIEILDKVINQDTNPQDIMHMGSTIFEIASNNRFYSKLYADLYTALIAKYEIMNIIFENNLNIFLELFKHIEQCNAEEDYDRFCKINKENEKRRALSAFFVNLTINKIIKEEQLFELTFNLLNQVYCLMKENNKKSEVDEMTENIAILYKKSLFENCNHKIDGSNIVEIINMLSHCKVKTHPSLSNKSIFKYMDMIDM